jgi:hypothetical protein
MQCDEDWWEVDGKEGVLIEDAPATSEVISLVVYVSDPCASMDRVGRHRLIAGANRSQAAATRRVSSAPGVEHPGVSLVCAPTWMNEVAYSSSQRPTLA